jgi:hypothetical protein
VKRCLLLALLLAGCAHKQPVEIREVPVPTPVTCVDPGAIPAEPARVARRLTGNAQRDLAIVAASAQDLRAWGQEMRSLLEQCVGRAPQG